MKYTKTKYPNIFTYETAKGKRYYVRRGFYLNGKKKEVTKSNLKTLPEARKALAEIETNIDNNEYDYNKNLTVNQYWDIYSELQIERGIWAPDTVATKEYLYNKHFKDWLGSTKLRSVSRSSYEQGMNDKLKNHTTHTVRQLHGIINAMFNHAKNNKVIADNPIDRIFIGKSAKKKKVKHLSLDDFKKWDETANKIFDSYTYSAIRLTYLGLRKSEVYGIKFGSLTKRPDGNYLIYLDESRTLRRKKGGKMKTESSKRYIATDPETSKLIDFAIRHSKEIGKMYGRILGEKDFLFITDQNTTKSELKGEPWSIRRLDWIFDKVSKACGIQATPHTMRHFFATQGQIAGVPIEHMASALGHSTSYMTQKYTHIKDEVAKGVTDKIFRSIG